MSDGSQKFALCLGHPGHELRVYGWMEQNRPLVDVFTDGSGPNRSSRFAGTRTLLENAGCQLGILRGEIPDRTLYEFIREQNASALIGFARDLAKEWEEAGVTSVAGDMLEGFSTTHDLCRMIINAGVEKLRRRGTTIRNYEFPLEAFSLPDPTLPGVIAITLDDAAFARKREAALIAYPAIASEAERLIAKHGEAVFRTEILLPTRSPAGLTWEHDEPPYYESYGRRQVKAGHYQTAITYVQHIQPLAKALWEWAQSEEP